MFCMEQAFASSEEQSHAYRYLANYHLKANQLEKAHVAAQKCTEFFEVMRCCFVVEFALLLMQFFLSDVKLKNRQFLLRQECPRISHSNQKKYSCISGDVGSVAGLALQDFSSSVLKPQGHG